MEKICTTNGDIGYHVKLKNSEGDEPMEEGDLVGFFADDNQATSDTRIERLTDVNASKAHLAGVITRSAYLQARTPGKHEDGMLHLLLSYLNRSEFVNIRYDRLTCLSSVVRAYLENIYLLEFKDVSLIPAQRP